MTKARRRDRGGIYKRGGKFVPIIDLGTDPATGKRHRKWLPACAGSDEAERALTAALAELDKGNDPFPTSPTVAQWMRLWLEGHSANVRASTLKRYRYFVERDVIPVIGNVDLHRVRPSHIRQVLAEASKRVGPTTVVQLRTVLNAAMRDAVADQLLATNPVAGTRRPKTSDPGIVIPDVEQVRALLDAAVGTPWEPAIVLAAFTGARRSEVLALRWQDVDVEAGWAAVSRQVQRAGGVLCADAPKTERAVRAVPLAAEARERLAAWRVKQARRRLVCGPAWNDLDLICDRGDGFYLDPSAFTHAFKRLGRKVGLDPATRLHDLRHGLATLMLEAGIDTKVTSAVLGHTSEAFTRKTYQHVRPKLAQQAAAALDAAFGRPS